LNRFNVLFLMLDEENRVRQQARYGSGGSGLVSDEHLGTSDTSGRLFDLKADVERLWQLTGVRILDLKSVP